jgi:hypothetical protein
MPFYDSYMALQSEKHYVYVLRHGPCSLSIFFLLNVDPMTTCNRNFVRSLPACAGFFVLKKPFNHTVSHWLPS